MQRLISSHAEVADYLLRTSLAALCGPSILRHGPYSEDLSVQLDNLDLMTLGKFYGLDFHDAHHALSDAFQTAQIWQKMLPALQAKGIRELRGLLKIGGV